MTWARTAGLSVCLPAAHTQSSTCAPRLSGEWLLCRHLPTPEPWGPRCGGAGGVPLHLPGLGRRGFESQSDSCIHLPVGSASAEKRLVVKGETLESERPGGRLLPQTDGPGAQRDAQRREQCAGGGCRAVRGAARQRLPFGGQSVAPGNGKGGGRGRRAHPAAKDPGGDPSGSPTARLSGTWWLRDGAGRRRAP